MVPLKSPNVKFDLTFLHRLLDDTSLSNPGFKRDKIKISSRLKNEGISFFTKTLPTLGAAIDLGLQTGKFILPSNFRRYKNSSLPCFLRGLISRLFDTCGNILTDIDLAAIAELRQICYAFYKLERSFTNTQQIVAELKFEQLDAELGIVASRIKNAQLPVRTLWVLDYAKDFLSNLFDGFDPYDITPSHGPGIVSSGEKPHEKRIFGTKYRSIHEEYPYYRYFVVNSTHLLHTVTDYRNRIQLEHGINSVLFVPKDSRGPRTIACEPLEYMFIQQGLRKSLYDYVERHAATRGRINFSDQTINQQLAHRASLPGSSLVTLDLKDASDSVSNELVKYLFSGTSLDKPLQALRTPISRLPSGKEIILNKYAAMGSALCFPIEALVFYSLIYGIHALRGEHKSARYVYGDDLIVDLNYYEDIKAIFLDLGLIINENKSCTRGFFRESCGKDYYLGNEVTYIKVRSDDASSPDGLASMVALANSMFERGYYRTAEYVEKYITSIFRQLPIGPSNASYLCYSSVRTDHLVGEKSTTESIRRNKRMQYDMVRRTAIRGSRYQISADDVSNEYAEYFRKMTQGWSPEFASGWYAKRHAVNLTTVYIEVGR